MPLIRPEALWEHKAFQYWAPKDMLAVPLNTWRYTGSGYYHYEYVSKLAIVHVAAGETMEVLGEVDHSMFFNADSSYWWGSSVNIRRSIFMGDYIYAISNGGITVTSLDDWTLTDSVALN